MINHQLLSLASGAWKLILRNVLFGLATTATYAGQGLAVAMILNDVFTGRSLSATLPMLAVVAVLLGCRAVLVWRREIGGIVIAGRIKRSVRARLFARLLDLGPGYPVGTRTGVAQAAIVDSVEALEKYYSRFLPQLVVTIVGSTILAAYVTSVDPVVGTVVICGSALVLASILGSRYLMRTAMRRWYDDFQALYAESVDALQGMTTLKAFNAHERRRADLHDQGARFAGASVRLMLTSSIPSGLVGVAASSGIALSVGLGAMRLAGGHISVSELFIVLLLARECFRPLTDLQQAFHFAYSAPAAARGVFALLDAPDIVRASGPRGPVTGPVLSPVAIAFEDVTFRYRAGAAASLDRLSFQVAPGETLALVGRSGAGKTTVVSTLLRFFDVESGRILVGGRDVREMPLAELHRLVAVVSQDTFLFHASVAENLRLADPEASQADLERAATDAHSHGFISSLPAGYETVVGERGLKLSGGERQRLSIARALLKDAPILILDEATSSVDAASEAAIQLALDRLTSGRTTLLIAHRLSTVRNADHLIVLDRGRPVEAGVPRELAGRAGAYARLVAAQGDTP